jgi:hypothetical protein
MESANTVSPIRPDASGEPHPITSRVDGTFRGRRFTVRLNRLDGCEIGRWNRLAFPLSRLPFR